MLCVCRNYAPIAAGAFDLGQSAAGRRPRLANDAVYAELQAAGARRDRLARSLEVARLRQRVS
jgi:hypothetical protein